MTSTAFAIDGFLTVKTLGVARGIIVRSRSIVGKIGVALQTRSSAAHSEALDCRRRRVPRAYSKS
jgi:uncharacterized protein YbjQ (UPF0145 family)